jgi:hypothetical protein
MSSDAAKSFRFACCVIVISQRLQADAWESVRQIRVEHTIYSNVESSVVWSGGNPFDLHSTFSWVSCVRSGRLQAAQAPVIRLLRACVTGWLVGWLRNWSVSSLAARAATVWGHADKSQTP